MTPWVQRYSGHTNKLPTVLLQISNSMGLSPTTIGHFLVHLHRLLELLFLLYVTEPFLWIVITVVFFLSVILLNLSTRIITFINIEAITTHMRPTYGWLVGRIEVVKSRPLYGMGVAIGLYLFTHWPIVLG